MSAASPYLGCKISLISKAEIRYEGLLYSIDAQESTVALANVRSFGTENRPTERPIPPRNEVFELIIFRGSDIKDLHVSEPPNKPPTPAAASWPQDPAIVEVSQPIAGGRVGGGDGLPGVMQAPKPLAQPSFPGTAGFVMPVAAPSPLSQPPPPFVKPESAAPSTQPATQTNAFHGYPTSKDSLTNDENSHEGEDQRVKERPQRDHIANDGSRPAAGRGRPLGPRPPPPEHGYPYPGNHGGFRPRGGFDGGMRGGPRGGRNGPPPARQQGRAQQPNAPRIDSDFDFESSNAKFDKEKFEKEFEEKLAINDDKSLETEKDDGETNCQFYDKKKSFFDSISCQSLDTEPAGRGRGANTDSRRLNSETFGNTVFRGGRRGGGGGYGNRGGYSGGGYGPRPGQGSYGPRDGGRMYSGGSSERGSYGRRMNNGGGHYDDYDGNRRTGRGGRYNEY